MVGVAVPRAPAGFLTLLPHFADERLPAGQLRAPTAKRVHRLPALLERHFVERAAAHLLAWRNAVFFDEVERAVPSPDGSVRRRRREPVGVGVGAPRRDRTSSCMRRTGASPCNGKAMAGSRRRRRPSP
jgi:hypothetical protein